LGYGVYMATVDWNGLTIFVLSFGGYTCISGLVGILLAMQTTGRKCAYLFVVLLSIAIAVELTFMIALKVDPNWTEKLFLGTTCGDFNSPSNFPSGGASGSGMPANSNSTCSNQVRQAEDFYDAHQQAVFMVCLIVIGVQLIAAVIACWFKSTHKHYQALETSNPDDHYAAHNDMENAYGPGRAASTRTAYDKMSQDRYDNPSTYSSAGANSESRAQADRLREKYGYSSSNAVGYNSGGRGSAYGGSRKSGYASETSDRGM